MPQFNIPDPPAPEPKEDTTACCDDPTPALHEGLVYCEACETEWVPAPHLTKARELYVALAVAKDMQSFNAIVTNTEAELAASDCQAPEDRWYLEAQAYRAIARRSDPDTNARLLKAAESDAGSRFDTAIAEHSKKTFKRITDGDE